DKCCRCKRKGWSSFQTRRGSNWAGTRKTSTGKSAYREIPDLRNDNLMLQHFSRMGSMPRRTLCNECSATFVTMLNHSEAAHVTRATAEDAEISAIDYFSK